MSKSAWDVQEGGDHYKNFRIQPLQYALENELGVCEHAVVKYVTRHRIKGGAADIKKAIHYLQLILENQYPEQAAPKSKPSPCQLHDTDWYPQQHVEEVLFVDRSLSYGGTD